MHKACHDGLPLFVTIISWTLSLHDPCGESCLQKGVHDYDVRSRTGMRPMPVFVFLTPPSLRERPLIRLSATRILSRLPAWRELGESTGVSR